MRIEGAEQVTHWYVMMAHCAHLSHAPPQTDASRSVAPGCSSHLCGARRCCGLSLTPSAPPLSLTPNNHTQPLHPSLYRTRTRCAAAPPAAARRHPSQHRPIDDVHTLGGDTRLPRSIIIRVQALAERPRASGLSSNTPSNCCRTAAAAAAAAAAPAPLQPPQTPPPLPPPHRRPRAGPRPAATRRRGARWA